MLLNNSLRHRGLFGLNKKARFTLKGLFFLSLFLYKTVLELIYVYILSPTYSYMYLYTSINVQKFFISLTLFLITAILLVKSRDCVSRNIVTTLYLFIFVPTISYYWLNDQSTLYTIFLALSFIIVILFSRLKLSNTTRIDSPFTDKKIISFVFVGFALFMALLIYMRGGIDARAFSFRNIYALREEENVVGFAGYLKNWMPKVLFPLLFGYFALKKKWAWLIVTVLFELLLYLSFGNKAFLLCIGWALICLFSMKKGFFPIWITFLLTLIVLASGLLSFWNLSDSLRDAIPYRLLFVPSQIQFQYYDYFSINEKMFYAEGWIGKLFGLTNKYGEDVAFMIHRINSPNGGVSHSNCCFLADAYYNLGFFGMILISCLSGFFFSLYNNFKRLPQALVLVSVSYIIFSFADTGFQTTLITGGMLMNFIMLYLLNYSYSNKIAQPFRWSAAR